MAPKRSTRLISNRKCGPGWEGTFGECTRAKGPKAAALRFRSGVAKNIISAGGAIAGSKIGPAIAGGALVGGVAVATGGASGPVNAALGGYGLATTLGALAGGATGAVLTKRALNRLETGDPELEAPEEVRAYQERVAKRKRKMANREAREAIRSSQATQASRSANQLIGSRADAKCGRGWEGTQGECVRAKPMGTRVARAAVGGVKNTLAAGAGAVGAVAGLNVGATAGAGAASGLSSLIAGAAGTIAATYPAITATAVGQVAGVGSTAAAAMVSTAGAVGSVGGGGALISTLVGSQVSPAVLAATSPYLVPAGAVLGLVGGGVVAARLAKSLFNHVEAGAQRIKKERIALANAIHRQDVGRIEQANTALQSAGGYSDRDVQQIQSKIQYASGTEKQRRSRRADAMDLSSSRPVKMPLRELSQGGTQGNQGRGTQRQVTQGQTTKDRAAGVLEARSSSEMLGDLSKITPKLLDAVSRGFALMALSETDSPSNQEKLAMTLQQSKTDAYQERGVTGGAGTKCNESKGWYGLKGSCKRGKKGQGGDLKSARSASLQAYKAKTGFSGKEGRQLKNENSGGAYFEARAIAADRKKAAQAAKNVVQTAKEAIKTVSGKGKASKASAEKVDPQKVAAGQSAWPGLNASRAARLEKMMSAQEADRVAQKVATRAKRPKKPKKPKAGKS